MILEPIYTEVILSQSLISTSIVPTTLHDICLLGQLPSLGALLADLPSFNTSIFRQSTWCQIFVLI